ALHHRDQQHAILSSSGDRWTRCSPCQGGTRLPGSQPPRGSRPLDQRHSRHSPQCPGRRWIQNRLRMLARHESLLVDTLPRMIGRLSILFPHFMIDESFKPL
ncbi:hypothetical protein PENTCL1PPCAC_27846, partial [Pristionchus entomophagus]